MPDLNGVPGSLTLGGYDQSRFTSNNVSFTFGSDDSRRLTLAIQSITATNTLQGDVTPLVAGILSLVDSTVPHIWLPPSACKIFEKAFGLVYDNNTDLYVMNDTVHARLQQLNPTVTLKLGNAVSGGDTVSIDLPYGAFDLQASSPIYTNATNYFPLRRASNESQYTLGRTFLQEAYVTADYERMNFSISQAVFRSDNMLQIMSIISANDTDYINAPSNTPFSGLDTGQITGIVVGVLAVAILATLIGLFLIWRRRKQRRVESRAELPAELSDSKSPPAAPTWPLAGKHGKRDMSIASTGFGELPACSQDQQSHPALRQSKPQELFGSPTAIELESPHKFPRSHTMDDILRAKHSQQNLIQGPRRDILE